jgi:hypothetical protein
MAPHPTDDGIEIVAHSSITHDATDTHVLASFGKPGADRSRKHGQRLRHTAQGDLLRAWLASCPRDSVDNWGLGRHSIRETGLPRCFLCMSAALDALAAGKACSLVAGSSKLVVVVGRCSKPRRFASGKLRRSDVVAAIARVTQPAQIQSCFCPHPPSLTHKPL